MVPQQVASLTTDTKPWEEMVKRLIPLFGVWGTLTLVFILCGFACVFLYLLLKHGEGGLREVRSLLLDVLKVLKSEPKKSHAAIKLELRLHTFLAVVVLFCFGGILLHAIIPWESQVFEQVVPAALISSLVLFVLLAIVSFSVALRYD